MDTQDKPDYDYLAAGFNPFMSRSIDAAAAIAVPSGVREINYDQQQVSGSLGSTLRVGNISIDGVTGRISIYDDNTNEVVRIGAQ